MFDLERWQEIFETLSKNKLRTFLTGLSVASGIFILVILLGFSQGIANGVKSQFEQDATNKISVWTGVTTKGYKGLNPGRYIQLKNSSFDAVVNEYDDYLEYRTKDYMIWGEPYLIITKQATTEFEVPYPTINLLKMPILDQGDLLINRISMKVKKWLLLGTK